MEVKEEKFDFPELSELKNLIGHTSKFEINKAVLNLKRSQKYLQKKITYRINEWSPTVNGKKVTRVSVKFTCCGDKDTCPALYFVKIKSHFLLLKRSRFTHTHTNSINPVQRQRSLCNSKLKNKKDLQPNNREKIQIEKDDENSSQNQNYSPAQSGYQEKKSIKQNLYQSERKFQFPDKEELKELYACSNQRQILTTLKKLLHKPIHQGKKIKYRVVNKKSIEKETQEVIYHKIIRFDCCKSYNRASYLHFVSNNDNQYTLKDYSLKHYHYRSHLHNSLIKENATLDKDILQPNYLSCPEEKDSNNSVKQSLAQQSIYEQQFAKYLDNNRINGTDQTQKSSGQLIQKDDMHTLTQIQYDYNNLLKYYYEIKEQQQVQRKKTQSNQITTKAQFQSKQINKASKDNSFSSDRFQSIECKSNNFDVNAKKQTQKTIPEFINLISQSQAQNVQEDDIQQSKVLGEIYPDNQSSIDIISVEQSISCTQQNPNQESQSSVVLLSRAGLQEEFEGQPQHEDKILSWFQMLHQQLTEFMQGNNYTQQVRFERFCKNSSLDLSWNIFSSLQQIQIWNRFFKLVIQSYGMQIIHVNQIVEKQSDYTNPFGWFCNKLFISKQRKIHFSQSKYQNELVYLLAQDVTLGHFEFKLLIGYSLSSQFKPKLLFLSFIQILNKTQYLTFKERLESNQLQPDQKIFIMINTALKYLEVQSAKLIYTSLDLDLMKALSLIKVQQSKDKLKIRITYQMHFECIKTLLNQNNPTENSQFDKEIIEYLSREIKLSANHKQIVQSFSSINNLFIHNYTGLIRTSQKSRIQNSQFIDPRKLLDSLKIFSQQFCHTLSSQDKFIGLGFTSNSFYFQNDQQNIKDPISELCRIFCHNKKSFYFLPQIFIFIQTIFTKYFNPTINSHKEFSSQKNVKRKQRQNQFFIFSNILEKFQLQDKKNQAIQVKFLKMFDTQISKVVKNCHRFVVNTFYRLLIKSFSLIFEDQKQTDMENQSNNVIRCKIKDSQTQKQFDVIEKYENKGSENQNIQILDEFRIVQETCAKKWHCSCKFYEFSGIPCQHQIFCTLKFDTPIITQLNEFWIRNN